MIALQDNCLAKGLLALMWLAHCFIPQYELGWFSSKKTFKIWFLWVLRDSAIWSPHMEILPILCPSLALSISPASHGHGLNELLLHSHSIFPSCKLWSVNIRWTSQLTNWFSRSFKIILLELFSPLLLDRSSATSQHVLRVSFFFPLTFSLTCSAHRVVVLTLLRSKMNNGNRNDLVPALWNHGFPERQRHGQGMGDAHTVVPPTQTAEEAGRSSHLRGCGGLPQAECPLGRSPES